MPDEDTAGIMTAADKRFVNHSVPDAAIVGTDVTPSNFNANPWTATNDTPVSPATRRIQLKPNDATASQIVVRLPNPGASLHTAFSRASVIRLAQTGKDVEFVVSRVGDAPGIYPGNFTIDGRLTKQSADSDLFVSGDNTGADITLYEAQETLFLGSQQSVVAYSSFSDTTSARDWRTESHAEVDNYDDNENVNLGSFTTATRDSVTNGAVVIPEDGTYSVRFAAEAVVGNTSGNAEYWGRVRMYVNGTKVRDGEVGHSRGQIISGSATLTTCQPAKWRASWTLTKTTNCTQPSSPTSRTTPRPPPWNEGRYPQDRRVCWRGWRHGRHGRYRSGWSHGRTGYPRHPRNPGRYG